MIDFEMRPRSDTWCPWSRAHCRIAAVSSRLDRAGVLCAAATDCRRTTPAPRATTSRPAASGRARHADERGQGLAQPRGVGLGQVDLVPPTVKPEIDRPRRLRTIQVVHKPYRHLLRHCVAFILLNKRVNRSIYPLPVTITPERKPLAERSLKHSAVERTEYRASRCDNTILAQPSPRPQLPETPRLVDRNRRG